MGLPDPTRSTPMLPSASSSTMNADHADTLILLARVLAGIESREAAITSLDRLGFHLRLTTPEGMRGVRIAFLREVASPAETRAVLIEMADRARKGRDS